MKTTKLIMALVAIITIVAGSTAFYLWGGGLDIPPTEPTYSELTISKAPTLRETAELTFKVWLREDYPHENRESMILISLPEGITWAENAFVTIDNEIKTLRIVPSSELIFRDTDNYTYFGVENVWITKKPLEVKSTIRAIKNGKWNIVADALTLTHQSSYATKFLGLFVSENEAYAQEGGFWPTPSFDNIKPSGAYVGVPSSNVKINLSASLTTNASIQLIATITALGKSLDVEAQIVLPSNLVLLNGSTNWRGRIDADSSVSFSVESSLPPDNRYYEIKACAEGTSLTHVYSDSTAIWLQISGNNLKVEETRPIENLFIGSIKLFPPQRTKLSHSPYVQTSGAFLQVMGRYSYFENRYVAAERRFISGWKPVGYATAELYRFDVIPFPLLSTTETDNNGDFVFDPIYIDPWPEGGLPIRVLINPDSNIVRVDRAFPYGGSYHYYIDEIIEHPDEGDIGSSGPAEYNEPWRVFTYINEAYRFLRDGQAQHLMPKVIAEWPEPESIGPFRRGTRYDDGTIFVEDKHDEFPDAVYHEYGHFVMDKVQGGTPPNVLPDHFMDTSSNETTAWAEGWANFFALVVDNDPYFATTPAWWNLENDPRRIFDIGDTVEGNVTGALWDLFDEADDNYTYWIWGDLPNYDHISLGFGPIWNVFRSGRFDTFNQFWNAFKSVYNDNAERKHFSKMALFQNTIDYNAWDSTCSIGDLRGTWQISPVTLTATAFPPDPDPEDQPYLSARFEYSTDGTNWRLAGVDDTPEYMWTPLLPPHWYAAYSIDWDAENLKDNTVWARASTNFINQKIKNNTRQDRR